MPNSDTQDGLFNKITKEIRNYETLATDPLTKIVCPQAFGGNVETAKAYFFHADALTSNDTNGTQLEYAITADGNGIKFTIAFGTKGTAGIAESDDWADTWTTTKATLITANKWVLPIAEENWREKTANGLAGSVVAMDWAAVDATPHLF
jgi:hypothetical protein